MSKDHRKVAKFQDSQAYLPKGINPNQAERGPEKTIENWL